MLSFENIKKIINFLVLICITHSISSKRFSLSLSSTTITTTTTKLLPSYKNGMNYEQIVSIVGTNVRLPCRFKSSHLNNKTLSPNYPSDTDIIWCYNYSICIFYIGVDRRINSNLFGDRFYLVGNRQKGEFDMEIRNVNINDTSMYRCYNLRTETDRRHRKGFISATNPFPIFNVTVIEKPKLLLYMNDEELLNKSSINILSQYNLNTFQCSVFCNSDSIKLFLQLELIGLNHFYVGSHKIYRSNGQCYVMVTIPINKNLRILRCILILYGTDNKVIYNDVSSSNLQIIESKTQYQSVAKIIRKIDDFSVECQCKNNGNFINNNSFKRIKWKIWMKNISNFQQILSTEQIGENDMIILIFSPQSFKNVYKIQCQIQNENTISNSKSIILSPSELKSNYKYKNNTIEIIRNRENFVKCESDEKYLIIGNIYKKLPKKNKIEWSSFNMKISSIDQLIENDHWKKQNWNESYQHVTDNNTHRCVNKFTKKKQIFFRNIKNFQLEEIKPSINIDPSINHTLNICLLCKRYFEDLDEIDYTSLKWNHHDQSYLLWKYPRNGLNISNFYKFYQISIRQFQLRNFINLFEFQLKLCFFNVVLNEINFNILGKYSCRINNKTEQINLQKNSIITTTTIELKHRMTRQNEILKKSLSVPLNIELAKEKTNGRPIIMSLIIVISCVAILIVLGITFMKLNERIRTHRRKIANIQNSDSSSNVTKYCSIFTKSVVSIRTIKPKPPEKVNEGTAKPNLTFDKLCEVNSQIRDKNNWQSYDDYLQKMRKRENCEKNSSEINIETNAEPTDFINTFTKSANNYVINDTSDNKNDEMNDGCGNISQATENVNTLFFHPSTTSKSSSSNTIILNSWNGDTTVSTRTNNELTKCSTIGDYIDSLANKSIIQDSSSKSLRKQLSLSKYGDCIREKSYEKYSNCTNHSPHQLEIDISDIESLNTSQQMTTTLQQSDENYLPLNSKQFFKESKDMMDDKSSNYKKNNRVNIGNDMEQLRQKPIMDNPFKMYKKPPLSNTTMRDVELYSLHQHLSPSDVESYEAPNFIFGKVPILPPREKMSSTNKNTKSKEEKDREEKQRQILIDDEDDFEEFPVEPFDLKETDEEIIFGDTDIWESNWDDDVKADQDFAAVLSKELATINKR
ncbi:hypothetical protein SNEBB_003297 [Seison nebaliae]|nr:hypothetical protein SNEBB_003297 [Seison nebaliae]